jgi:aminoglycoside 3-N-acetyltransferase
MNETQAAQAMVDLLKSLGVKKGQTIFLGIDMGRVPLPAFPAALSREAIRAREEKWCAFLLDCLIESVGPQGTILVPTFSYRCGNPANPFSHEETPSEVGPFTDWLRRRPGTIRSVHPIFSVAGIGPNAGAILDNAGGAAFGPLSPFGRIAAFPTRFVSLGVPFHLSVTYLHHLEQCHGCNHRYHKVITTKVSRNGKEVAGPFMAYLRWRGINAGPDFSRCEKRLLAEGAMTEVMWNGRVNHAVDLAEVDRIGYAMLAEDPCAFASRPVRVDLDDAAVGAKPSGDPVATFRLSFPE